MKLNIVVTGINREDMKASPEKWIHVLLKTPAYGNGKYRLIKILKRKQLTSQKFYPKVIEFDVEVV
jgi:hypothetical protein